MVSPSYDRLRGKFLHWNSAIRFVLCILLAVAGTDGATCVASISVLPDEAKEFRQSLDGQWSFKYIPALHAGSNELFYEPAFSVLAWQTIAVPANWELQGIAEPKYELELNDGLGLYRRTFHVPGSWRQNRRICLRFEGVAFGFEAWVNGTNIGRSSASAFNPNTFDITDALRSEPDADNVLAVKVSTKPHAWEFDVNDDWSLSGIYRDVTLFSVPTMHLDDVTTRTKLCTNGDAELSVSALVNLPGAGIRGTLLAPDGHPVDKFRLLPQSNETHAATIHLARPLLWTAETPSLYRLQLSLYSGGQVLQTVERRIGLREIAIVGGILQLNGRPVKLRGVNHHDLDPVHGRAITEPDMRRDLDLMKKGNVNFIRASHYPPNRRFVELCDELGFYLVDEVPIGRGESHDKDPAYRENIFARTEATIMRDKNHPSVIIWSIGNENPITDILLDAGRLAKELDPSRPICYPTVGSYFEKNYERFPDFVDIYSPHYPNTTTLKSYAQKLNRPLVLTEYAHALGLAADRIQNQWEVLQSVPTFAGGAIWHFMDQGLLRTNLISTLPAESADYVWLDQARYYDTHGNDGCDGIVYSDRTPQTDFWEARKVYSPVQITNSTTPVRPGAQEIDVVVQNRYDFRSLKGMKLQWSLRRNLAELKKSELPLAAPAHGEETVRIPLTIPGDAQNDILTLRLSCSDSNGLQVTEHTVRLNLSDADPAAWLDNLPAQTKPAVSDSGNIVRIRLSQWMLTVNRTNGMLAIHDYSGRSLIDGIYPHPGRKQTMAEKIRAERQSIWQGATLSNVTAAKVDIAQQSNVVHIAVTGRYPRPDDAGQTFVGGYEIDIVPSGLVHVHYDYGVDQGRGQLLEAGLSLILPAPLAEFRWIGQGPYPAYPGKDRLDEFGLFHLNREDLYFQGNRREVEWAMLTKPNGAGVALATKPADVAVERMEGGILLSHNARVSGLGNKAAAPETNLDSAAPLRISGSFTLLLFTDTWPKPVTHWFGQPTTKARVFKPFFRSYDQ